MQTYKEIIDKNKELLENSIRDSFVIIDSHGNGIEDVFETYNNGLISYLEEENNRLEESKQVERWTENCCPRVDEKSIAYNQAINEQVEHNKNVIAYINGL